MEGNRPRTGRDTGARPTARSRWARAGLVAALLAFGALALVALSGGASAYHGNATCQGGGYTQTWNVDVTIFVPLTPIVDECILVRANVTVDALGELRLRDSRMVFDNTLGNFTLFVNGTTLLEFRDDDGNTSTNDRSWLGVLDTNITWTGFFFANGPGARIFFNDTDIVGGGLPGGGISSVGGFYVDAPSDFSWSRVTHTTPSTGLILVNYTDGLTIPDYAVSGVLATPFLYGLVLDRCSNVTITGYSNPGLPGETGIFVDESDNIAIRNSTAKTIQTGFRFLIVTDLLIEDTDSLRHSDRGFWLERVDGAVLNRVSANVTISAQYGLFLDSSKRVEVTLATLRNHRTADFTAVGTTRWVNVTDATMTRGPSGSGIRIQGNTGDSDSAADIAFRQVNVTQKGQVGGYAVYLRYANRVLFEDTHIARSAGTGLWLDSSADVRFVSGTITSCTGGAVYSTSANVTIERSDLINNSGGGLTVGGGSFTLETVNVRGTGPGGFSIRSTRTATLTGNSSILNSTLEGYPEDVVQIHLTGQSAGARLRVSNVQFVRQSNVQQLYFALNLEGFSSVDVGASSMSSFGIRVARTSTVNIVGPSMELLLLLANTTLLRFEDVASLVVRGVTFGADPLAGQLGTVIHVTNLTGSATFADMALPRADFGITVQGLGGVFLASVIVQNVSMIAFIEGVNAQVVHDAQLSNITVYRSQRAVVVGSWGTGTRFALADSTLQASGVAVGTSGTDEQALIQVTNITFDRTNSTPAVGLFINTAKEVWIAGVRVRGIHTGVDILDARWVRLSDMDFEDNTWGLRVQAAAGVPTDVNWTVDRDTRISNSHIRMRGDVWVFDSALSITAGSSISLFATDRSPTYTRFHFEGASRLDLNESSRVFGEAGIPVIGSIDARFTMELSAQSTISVADALLDGLGRTGAVPPEQKGLYVQAQDTTLRNVTFLNVTSAISASGVDVTVIGCTIRGVDGQDKAIEVWNATVTVRSGTSFAFIDGVRVQNGVADISNASFDGVGAALAAIASSADFVDSSISSSTEAIRATFSSSVMACRLFVIQGQVFYADGGSTIRICDSYTIFARDGDVHGGAVVEYENTYVDNFDESGRMTYSTDTAGGRFVAYWELSFFVSSCPPDYSRPVAGADIDVFDRWSSVIFGNQTTDSSGFAGPHRFRHYESQDNVEVYYGPLTMTARLGALVSSVTSQANQTEDILICLDDKPPNIHLIYPATLEPAPTRNRTITIRGSSSDNVSDIEELCMSVNGGECTPLPPNFDTQRPLQEGLNTILIVSRDTFGNEIRVTIRAVRDTTPPMFLDCNPSFTFKGAVAEVDLACQMAGDPVDPPTISGVAASRGSIDAMQVLSAHITLIEGSNTFRITVADALDNRNGTDFSWTLDTKPPKPTLTSGYNQTVSRDYGIFMRGTVPADTASVEVDGVSIDFGGLSFSHEWKNLTEGFNWLDLMITDDVGNVWTSPFWVDLDKTTNCTLFAPDDGIRWSLPTIAVGGSCDRDVVVRIEGVAGALYPAEDGRWSGEVGLHQGPNIITVNGEDPNGANWTVSVRVTYDATGTNGDLPFAFIVMVILAAGVLIAAVVLMRRPRRPPPKEMPRPMTGAQKAPPRAKPAPMRLPEIPEDQEWRRPPPQR